MTHTIDLEKLGDSSKMPQTSGFFLLGGAVFGASSFQWIRQRVSIYSGLFL